MRRYWGKNVKNEYECLGRTKENKENHQSPDRTEPGEEGVRPGGTTLEPLSDICFGLVL